MIRSIKKKTRIGFLKNLKKAKQHPVETASDLSKREICSDYAQDYKKFNVCMTEVNRLKRTYRSRKQLSINQIEKQIDKANQLK